MNVFPKTNALLFLCPSFLSTEVPLTWFITTFVFNTWIKHAAVLFTFLKQKSLCEKGHVGQGAPIHLSVNPGVKLNKGDTIWGLRWMSLLCPCCQRGGSLNQPFLHCWTWSSAVWNNRNGLHLLTSGSAGSKEIICRGHSAQYQQQQQTSANTGQATGTLDPQTKETLSPL